jgi:hypothetical protein
MEANRHADGGGQIHRGHDPEIDAIDCAIPEQHDRGEHADERKYDPEQVRESFGTGHALHFLDNEPQILAQVRAIVAQNL